MSTEKEPPQVSNTELASVLPRTEQRQTPHVDLEALDTIELLKLLNEHDRQAITAVNQALPHIAELVQVAADAVRGGGSVHYFGAGTSGRLAVLDAAELLPTFNLDQDVVVAHIAGGDNALRKAIEDAEDSFTAGCTDGSTLTSKDVVIGLTASGNTPYVGGALSTAQQRGAYAALVSCNPQATLTQYADTHVLLDTGPEVLTGSTRLKAGTAEKLMLNGFSTALMVQLGRTWSNLMVSVVATNKKLRQRTIRILIELTGLSTEQATALLGQSGGELKTAIVSHLGQVAPDQARIALSQSQQSVRQALTDLSTR